MKKPNENMPEVLQSLAARFPEKVYAIGDMLQDVETGALFHPASEADALNWIAAGESED